MDLKQYLYVLDGHNVRETDDVAEWAKCSESPERVVAHESDEYYEVSTVFLGIRHNHFHAGPPILFESMVFATDAYRTLVPHRESLDRLQLRYASWDDAATGHEALVKRLKKHVEFALSGGYQEEAETAKSDH